jgi:hypothetical protein
MNISTSDSADDVEIENLVERISRAIDNYTGYWFYASTATRYYRVGVDTAGRTLYLDAPLLSVTTLTNADGEVITSGYYVLEPLNQTARFRIKLTPTGGKVWQYTSDPDADTISVAGAWGYMASTTDTAIELATLITLKDAYDKRQALEGEGDRITAGGIVVRASQFPRRALELLEPFVKRSL